VRRTVSIGQPRTMWRVAQQASPFRNFLTEADPDGSENLWRRLAGRLHQGSEGGRDGGAGGDIMSPEHSQRNHLRTHRIGPSEYGGHEDAVGAGAEAQALLLETTRMTERLARGRPIWAGVWRVGIGVETVLRRRGPIETGISENGNGFRGGTAFRRRVRPAQPRR
jgi:hypothetical protein